MVTEPTASEEQPKSYAVGRSARKVLGVWIPKDKSRDEVTQDSVYSWVQEMIDFCRNNEVYSIHEWLVYKHMTWNVLKQLMETHEAISSGVKAAKAIIGARCLSMLIDNQDVKTLRTLAAHYVGDLKCAAVGEIYRAELARSRAKVKAVTESKADHGSLIDLMDSLSDSSKYEADS